MNTTSEVKVKRPLENVALLEHTDPGARQADIATNTYVLFGAEDQALLIDASFDYLLPPLRAVLDGRYHLTGLALTHRHLAENGGSTLLLIAETFGVPVLLHPVDVAALRRPTPGLNFEDPMQSGVLQAFGLETVLFPGHTEGHVMYYRPSDGLLLAGDAAMGSTRKQAAQGTARLVRPPSSLSVDDRQLQRAWVAFDRPIRHVLPFHGALFTGHTMEDMARTMHPLRREEPTRGIAG